MSDEHRPDNGEILTPLDAAVQAVLAERLSENAIQRVKARAKQLALATDMHESPRRSFNKRGSQPRILVKGLVAAAAMLALATGAFVLLDRSASQAIAQVIEKVKAARSVRFATMTRSGRGREIDGRMYLEGNRARMEQSDRKLIQIGDFDAKQVLLLDTRRRVAQSMSMERAAAEAFANPIEQLRRATARDAEQMGQEFVDGRRADVFRLRQGNLFGIRGAEMLVWVDVASELPSRIVIHNPDPKAEMEFRFDDFVWNEPVDAELFALDVPAGFKSGVVSAPVRFRKPTEGDAARPDSAPAFANGVLRDRVPADILWCPQGERITAMMRDPESVSAQGGRLNELRQWNVATGKLTWSQNVAGASAAASTADGKTLATVIGFEVQLRDAASGDITKKWTTDEPLSPLAFSPDGKTLAAGITEWGPHGGREDKMSGGIQLWDVSRGSLVRSFSDDEPVTFVNYSADGRYLATSSNAGPVKLWDAATGKLSRVIPGRSRGAFSPDGETIACISASSADRRVGRLELYRVGDASFVRSFRTAQGRSASWLLGVIFSPDGQLLAATDWNGTVTLWDVATGRRKRTSIGHQAGVLAVAFSPDGATLATGSEDKTLRLWKLSEALID